MIKKLVVTAFVAVVGFWTLTFVDSKTSTSIYDVSHQYGVSKVISSGGWSGSAVPYKREGNIVYFLTAKHVADIGVWRYTINSVPAKLVKVHDTLDISILSVLDSDKKFRVVPLAKKLPKQLSDVYAIGYAGGLNQIVSKGLLQGTKLKNYIISTSPISAGNSGGALVYCQYGKTGCELIGVTVAVRKESRTLLARHIVYSIALDDIQKFVLED